MSLPCVEQNIDLLLVESSCHHLVPVLPPHLIRLLAPSSLRAKPGRFSCFLNIFLLLTVSSSLEDAGNTRQIGRSGTLGAKPLHRRSWCYFAACGRVFSFKPSSFFLSVFLPEVRRYSGTKEGSGLPKVHGVSRASVAFLHMVFLLACFYIFKMNMFYQCCL